MKEARRRGYTKEQRDETEDMCLRMGHDPDVKAGHACLSGNLRETVLDFDRLRLKNARHGSGPA